MLSLKKCVNKINKLCLPAYLYMIYSVLSVFSTIYIIYSNSETNRNFKIFLQQYGINISNMEYNLLILGKISQAVFSVFIIDLLCRNKYNTLAWLIITFTFIGDLRLLF